MKKLKKATFIKIDDIDVNNILISKKEPCDTKNSFKYFIGYTDNDIIRPLCMKLLQMTGYERKFNENVTMSFKVNDKQLLKNYNRIWEKIENLMRRDFESKPVCGDDDKCIKAKIKIYAKNMVTNFHNQKMSKEKVPRKCSSIIMADSVIKANKKILSSNTFRRM